jgi:hypothetical protein
MDICGAPLAAPVLTLTVVFKRHGCQCVQAMHAHYPLAVVFKADFKPGVRITTLRAARHRDLQEDEMNKNPKLSRRAALVAALGITLAPSMSLAKGGPDPWVRKKKQPDKSGAEIRQPSTKAG